MVELNNDGTAMVLGKTLDTAAMELLIEKLLIARSKMLPKVPMNLQEQLSNVVPQEEPRILVSRAENDAISLCLRHEGLGWCVFLLSQRMAAMLRDGLAKRTVGVNVNYSDEKTSHRH